MLSGGGLTSNYGLGGLLTRKKVINILGTRPQLVKAAVLSMGLKKDFKEIIVHTGQHYDEQMSTVFFNDLGIPRPKYSLGIGSGSHGEQTGKMLIEIEKVLVKEKPDLVIIEGDTNSALAGTLVAVKLHIPIVHVEAGLRSYNRKMPEEINRILIDHISEFLFCPSILAEKNLLQEGIKKNVFVTGDVMFDALKYFLKIAEKKSKILEKLNLEPKKFNLLTIHRAENTNKNNLTEIFEALMQSKQFFVFPIHPRTLKFLKEFKILEKLEKNKNFLLIEPVSYLDMLLLEENARKILTDSGGIQKEAYWLRVPCITLRNETEWIETVSCGWNLLVRSRKNKIIRALQNFNGGAQHLNFYGDGKAVYKISKIIKNFLR